MMDLSLNGLATLIESGTAQINEVPVFASLTDNSYFSSDQLMGLQIQDLQDRMGLQFSLLLLY